MHISLNRRFRIRRLPDGIPSLAAPARPLPPRKRLPGESASDGLPSERRLQQQIRTRHLLLLDALERHGSLRQAAEVLAITQPAASKLLAQLESLLGLPLFERTRRGLVATAYGRIMLHHARAALGEITAARDALAYAALGALGRIALGAVVGSLPRLTAVAIASLLARHPRLAVAVTVETSATLVPMLARGELELVVGQLPEGADPDELDFEPLVAEPVEIVARFDHRLARKRRLSLRELVEEAWVLPPPGTPLRVRLDAMFHAAGLDVPRRRVETASTLLATSLALAGGMVALLSRDVARHYAGNTELAVLPVSLPADLGSIGLIRRRRLPLSPAALNLAAELRRIAAGIADTPTPSSAPTRPVR